MPRYDDIRVVRCREKHAMRRIYLLEPRGPKKTQGYVKTNLYLCRTCNVIKEVTIVQKGTEEVPLRF